MESAVILIFNEDGSISAARRQEPLLIRMVLQLRRKQLQPARSEVLAHTKGEWFWDFSYYVLRLSLLCRTPTFDERFI